jgi:hypothetical protein
MGSLLSAGLAMAPAAGAWEGLPPLPEYTIRRTADPIVVDGKLDEPSWRAAEPVGPFRSPWYEGDRPRATEARMLWDDDYLYVGFVVEDEHITAHLTERDDPVWREDCVEVFVAPDPDNVRIYFNFEFNAIGTMLDRTSYLDQGLEWNAEGVLVAITHDGTLNDASDTDRGWVAEIAIPFQAFAGAARRLPPHDGDTWRLNLYRLNDESDRQHSVWSHTGTERPSFHEPERFGVVRFSSRPVAATPADREGK